MSKFILLFGSLVLLFVSSMVNSSSTIDDELLEKRCRLLVEQINNLEQVQHKLLCKDRLFSASRQIRTSAIKIQYQNYKDAELLLASSIRDLHFAVEISCVLKYEIDTAKKEAFAIMKEVS